MLDARLLKVLSKIENGTSLADIGCDHGYLGIEALKQNLVEKCYFADVNHEPLAQAQKNVTQSKLLCKSEFILSNGFENLINYHFDYAAICGMGGKLISHIITDYHEHLHETTLILAPNNNSYSLRQNLQSIGFKCVNNDLVICNNIIYHIITAKYVGQFQEDELFLKYGFDNINSKNPLLIKELESRLNYLLNENNYIKNKFKDEIIEIKLLLKELS